jgi:hypothetical protein
MSWFATPSDANNTSRARDTKPAGIDVDRTHCSSLALSPSLNTKAAAVRLTMPNDLTQT